MPGPCGNNQPGDDFDDDYRILETAVIALLHITESRRDRVILDLFAKGVQLVADTAGIKWLKEDGAKAARRVPAVMPRPEITLADLKPADFEFPYGGELQL